ncbi:ANTAR domain-containing protein [Mycolicibacterium sp. XJ2]
MHDQLLAAVTGRRGLDAADRLCEACVVLLGVDAVAISLVFDGVSSATLGSSGASARRYDELQFILGEGPCLESVTGRAPVLVDDLDDPDERRWPVYAPAMVDLDVRGVFAMPVVIAGEYVGALDLFRAEPGPLERDGLAGAAIAAEMAGVPLLDMLDTDLRAAVTDPGSNEWSDLHALARVEVSQATGTLVAQLGVEPADALVRLRAHAYSTGRSATEVARDILDRGLRLDADRCPP